MRTPTKFPPIFVCYRREEAGGYVNGLVDRLKAHFGKDAVFRDLHSIHAGKNYMKALNEAVGSCKVLIVVIGRQWLDEGEEKRRIDDPDDFVRLEIEAGLRRDIPIVPLLVQGAAMPTKDSLPESLAPLAFHQALEIRDVSWEYDVGELIRQLEEYVPERANDPRAGRRRVIVGAIVAACAALSVAALLFGGRLIGSLVNRNGVSPNTSNSKPDGPPSPDSNNASPTNLDPEMEELRAYSAARRANTIEGFKRYLDKYPSGPHAQDARNEIQKLEEQRKRQNKNEAVTPAVNLDGTTWRGRTTSGRPARYTFEFRPGGRFRLSLEYNDTGDEQKIWGEWSKTNNSVKMFITSDKTMAELRISGTLDGDRMTGSITNPQTSQTWNWSVSKVR